MPGRVLATTDYIAPEQALGEPVSGRSDLYSLGIVLFEMLTGDVPFHGESAVAVAMKHVREQVPDVQRLRPGVSAATAAVVERATAKDPAQRYPDADEHGGRPRAGAGAGDLALGPGHGRGDLDPADAAGRRQGSRALAGAPPRVGRRRRWPRWFSPPRRGRCWRPSG